MMVDKYPIHANEPKSRLLDPVAIVIVLKKANRVVCIERPDSLQDIPSHRDAEECQERGFE
jgi:hypothetical protein